LNKMHMLFYSTNHQSSEVNLRDALFTGQAPDKGLYMPKNFPLIEKVEWDAVREKSYPEIANWILSKYCEGTIPAEKLELLCQDAYNYRVPLEHVTDKKYILRLDQGPTASFKDFAARMMGRWFGALLSGDEKETVILTATSGDTGSAIAHAFYGIPNIQVMVLFPPDEVSNRQRKQMTTLGGNITIVGIDGKFDDCQALVKQAFADPQLKDIQLTSANSINIGRLLPQAVYYIYAFLKISKNLEPIVISVPSGNFGNMMGCLLAWKMGLPIKRLVISTNANDEVPVYLRTGSYEKIVPSKNCISNAMNVGHPSNFTRVIDLFGGHMDETGKIHKEPDLEAMHQLIWSVSIGDQETRETIQKAWEKHQLLLEPHGAVGWAGLGRYLENHDEDIDIPMVSVETAHPAKFPEEIETLLGIVPEVPASLKMVEEKNEHYLEYPNDYETFKTLLVKSYRS